MNHHDKLHKTKEKEEKHGKHKLQKLGRESMEELVRKEGEKHPGGG